MTVDLGIIIMIMIMIMIAAGLGCLTLRDESPPRDPKTRRLKMAGVRLDSWLVGLWACGPQRTNFRPADPLSPARAYFAATNAPFLRTITGLSTLLLTVNGNGDRMIMPYYF